MSSSRSRFWPCPLGLQLIVSLLLSSSSSSVSSSSSLSSGAMIDGVPSCPVFGWPASFDSVSLASSSPGKVKVRIRDFRTSTDSDQDSTTVVRGILDIGNGKLMKDETEEAACIQAIVCGEDGEYYSNPCSAADFGVASSLDYGGCEGKPEYSLVACDNQGVCHGNDDDDEAEGDDDDYRADNGEQGEPSVKPEQRHSSNLSDSAASDGHAHLPQDQGLMPAARQGGSPIGRPSYIPGPVHLFLGGHVPVRIPNPTAGQGSIDVNTFLRGALLSTDIPARVTSVVFWASHITDGGALFLLLKRADGDVCFKTVDLEKRIDLSFDCGPSVFETAQYAQFQRGRIQRAKNRDFNDARLVYLRTATETTSCYSSFICARYHRNGTLTYVGHATDQSIAASTEPFLLYTNRGSELEIVDYTTPSPPNTKRRYSALELLQSLEKD